jgi:hypothetical protein
MLRAWLADELSGIQHHRNLHRHLGNLACLYKGQEMTFDEKQNGATPIEIIDYLRGVIDTLRAEKALLEKRYEALEASRETWQKLAQAWEWLADNKRIVPADEA